MNHFHILGRFLSAAAQRQKYFSVYSLPEKNFDQLPQRHLWRANEHTQRKVPMSCFTLKVVCSDRCSKFKNLEFFVANSEKIFLTLLRWNFRFSGCNKKSRLILFYAPCLLLIHLGQSGRRTVLFRRNKKFFETKKTRPTKQHILIALSKKAVKQYK